MNVTPQPVVRQPYQAPRLTTYGSLGQITAAVGRDGRADGGPGLGSMSKTS